MPDDRRGGDALRAHAEAMADALEDLVFCEHDDEMWARARAVWQAYVDWTADTGDFEGGR